MAGREDNRHGVILAKNEPAKKYGIKTLEPIFWGFEKMVCAIPVAFRVIFDINIIVVIHRIK